MTEGEAALCSAGLIGRIVSAPHIKHGDLGLNGIGVTSTSPASGALVHKGSLVLLHLGPDVNAGGGWLNSQSPGPSRVPKVIGMDVDDAVTALTGSFVVDITVVTPASGLVVTDQSPGAGAHLNGGGTVAITAGSPPGGPCP